MWHLKCQEKSTDTTNRKIMISAFRKRYFNYLVPFIENGSILAIIMEETCWAAVTDPLQIIANK